VQTWCVSKPFQTGNPFNRGGFRNGRNTRNSPLAQRYLNVRNSSRVENAGTRPGWGGKRWNAGKTQTSRRPPHNGKVVGAVARLPPEVQREVSVGGCMAVLVHWSVCRSTVTRFTVRPWLPLGVVQPLNVGGVVMHAVPMPRWGNGGGGNPRTSPRPRIKSRTHSTRCTAAVVNHKKSAARVRTTKHGK